MGDDLGAIIGHFYVFIGLVCNTIFMFFYFVEWQKAKAREEKLRNELEKLKKVVQRTSKNRGDSELASYVYLLKDLEHASAYKIGKTNNPHRRFKNFDTIWPFDYEVVHIIKSYNPYELEAGLHRKYADKRIRGEWFELDDDEIDEIMQL